MRTSQRNRPNVRHTAPTGAARICGASSRARPGFCPKALMFLLTAFVICAFAQTIQLNNLLADAASVSESVAELREERELISAGYASYFSNLEKYGSSRGL